MNCTKINKKITELHDKALEKCKKCKIKIAPLNFMFYESNCKSEH